MSQQHTGRNEDYMNIDGHDIGVCSWSLRPRDMATSSRRSSSWARARAAGAGHCIQLDDKRKHQELGALRNWRHQAHRRHDGIPDEDYGTIALIRQTGGFVPDDRWPIRKALMKQAAISRPSWGCKLLSSHIGFIPPSSESKYNTMVERVCEIAEPLNAQGITLMMETGQEVAPELLQFLNDLRCQNVQVNFDPANMILYGAGDPIEAIETLGRHIGHVHVKDATLSARRARSGGPKVPVRHRRSVTEDFLRALHDAGYTGPLVIEREAGETASRTCKTAIQTLQEASRG
jgi:hypothetical protein